MTSRNLADIARKMREIDVAILSTRTDNGAIASRPMSNNRDVDYDGDSYYFALEDARLVGDIRKDPTVGLSFHGHSGIFGGKPFFVAVEGRAELIDDRASFDAHWTADLDRWFDQGVDTPGLKMIKVHADRLHYWDGSGEAELKI